MRVSISVFTTNDDDQKLIFTNTLCCRPVLGDRIESKDRHHVRKVVGITFNHDGSVLLVEVARR